MLSPEQLKPETVYYDNKPLGNYPCVMPLQFSRRLDNELYEFFLLDEEGNRVTVQNLTHDYITTYMSDKAEPITLN